MAIFKDRNSEFRTIEAVAQPDDSVLVSVVGTDGVDDTFTFISLPRADWDELVAGAR